MLKEISENRITCWLNYGGESGFRLEALGPFTETINGGMLLNSSKDIQWDLSETQSGLNVNLTLSDNVSDRNYEAKVGPRNWDLLPRQGNDDRF
jgi:hypothetical protein